MTDPLSIPNITVLKNLPYLSAFNKKGLRLHGAVPSLLERIVPSPPPKRSAPSSPPGLAS
ncbi:hypothetical protein FIBSPDRAFT_866903 [Athelia psychrophila]|uniref:Uncharacterized protein n=1 Tax=Athelia psychrophila TaxID=1759441 RepID=A0A166EFU7_9AGAM|nr:hypothetical protein FIBSPDRAFT_866903 [Fibularhizoctonia sp. CBS 109695]